MLLLGSQDAASGCTIGHEALEARHATPRRRVHPLSGQSAREHLAGAGRGPCAPRASECAAGARGTRARTAAASTQVATLRRLLERSEVKTKPKVLYSLRISKQTNE